MITPVTFEEITTRVLSILDTDTKYRLITPDLVQLSTARHKLEFPATATELQEVQKLADAVHTILNVRAVQRTNMRMNTTWFQKVCDELGIEGITLEYGGYLTKFRVANNVLIGTREDGPFIQVSDISKGDL